MSGASASAPTRRDPAGLGDLLAGAATAALGIAVVVHVRSFPDLPDGSPGPALFPTIIGGLLAVFGAVLVVRFVRDRLRAAPQAGSASGSGRGEAGYESLLDETTSARTAWVNALSVLGSIVAYLLLVDVLGFGLTMGLLLVGLMWRLGARLIAAVPSAVITTFLVFVLFERVLLVPLPPGPFG